MTQIILVLTELGRFEGELQAILAALQVRLQRA